MTVRLRALHEGMLSIWAASSEFVSSSIPSWQILTAHAQPFRRARDLAFCLKVPLDSLLVWASSGGSGETARMRRLAWTFAARIRDKHQIRLTRPILFVIEKVCSYYGRHVICLWLSLFTLINTSITFWRRFEMIKMILLGPFCLTIS